MAVIVKEAMPKFRRLVDGSSPDFYDKHVVTAKKYCERVKQRGEGDAASQHYAKPLDRDPGHPSYFEHVYGMLNILKAMPIPPGAHVLEVGCGPGWITEILMGLGYAVHAIEPSEDFIEIAKNRIITAKQHYRISEATPVAFHCTTIEDCDLPDGSMDAVLFFDSLHHVIDEDKALAQCHRILRPGGILGISEAEWIPGNRGLEVFLYQAMEKYGALESPFTAEYLDYLLRKHNFEDAVRYFSVNGLFPCSIGNVPIGSLSQERSNKIVAFKPFSSPTTKDVSARTEAQITILNAQIDKSIQSITVKVKLVNTGDTVWLHSVLLSDRGGFVTVPLFSRLENGQRIEAEPRARLPWNVRPGEEVVLDLTFLLPEGSGDRIWAVDMIDEELFWFSDRGTIPAVVRT
jgi:2-polyprenyl-3-methyl-5-hydroxy-6-metoxy-1,4-benzoquinol methylase